MIGLFTKKKLSPIGLDLGTRSVKLVQLNQDRTRVVEAARWDLPLDVLPGDEGYSDRLIEAIGQAREGRRFRGREVVLCLGWRQLSVQNLRVPKPAAGVSLEPIVRQEVESRLPFPTAEAELRFLETADVRQGDAVRREVIVMACHRPVLDQTMRIIDAAGLRPVAVEVEPAALLRCYHLQYRRGEDQHQRSIYVHVGHGSTVVIIAQGAEVLFVKYIELGGKHFDEGVARHLQMSLADAWALRRHNGDRRTDQQDPEVARSVVESIRPLVDKLVSEVSLCVRYHSVTFRGRPLTRLVLAGGEATQALVDTLAAKIDIKCELGDPLRSFEHGVLPGRKGQWDVALGLALRGL